MVNVLKLYRSAFERYVQSWEEGSEGAYFEDWTDYLSNAPMEVYDSEGDQGHHFQFMAEMETAARIQRAALLSAEHACFMVWLEVKGKQELYKEFEEGSFPRGGTPVSP